MNRNSRLLIRFLVFANMATIVLFLFPPIVRVNTNAPFVVGYLLLSVLLIFSGLKKGINKGRASLYKQTKVFIPSKKLTNFIFVFYTLTALLRYAYLLGFAPLEISSMVGRLAVGIADPQIGYHLVQERPVSVVPWSVYFLISIIDQLFFIYFMVVWRSLGYLKRILGVVYMGIEMFYWMGCGTNFGMIVMFTNIIFALLLIPLPQKNKKRSGYRMVIGIGFLVVVALSVFSYNMLGRTGEGDSDVAKSRLMAQFVFRDDSLILQILPESLWSSYYYIYSYLCQGYEALGSAMNLPVTWTFFCGNNPALISLVNFLTGYNPFTDSYMVSLEAVYHIDSLVAWHSAYLWWANDFTILGTLVIVYFISVLCGFAFVLGSKRGDVISSIVFIVLANMILFLFANNTYLSNVFYSFMLLFPYWLFTRFANPN